MQQSRNIFETSPTDGINLPGRRLLIVEEGLRDYKGHWFEYVNSVAEINKRSGIHVTIAAHRGIDQELALRIGAHGVFAQTNWDGIYHNSQAWRRYLGIAQHNWRVYGAMSQFLNETGPYDCVFVPTVVIHHIGAWRLLALRELGHSIKRLVLLFRNNIAQYDSDGSEPRYARTGIVWRKLLQGFEAQIRNGSVCFATDSDRLAREYEFLSGIRPAVFPIPRIAGFQDATERAPGAPFVFACLGPSRFEKGIDLLQSAAKRFLVLRPNAHVRFVFQWDKAIRDERGAVYRPDPELVSDYRVRFITEPLDSAAYDAELRATDCMVLPYRRVSYFARTSGVAVEAVTTGIPVIYTEKTWMAELVERVGAGVAIRDGDIDCLMAAMDRIFNEQDLFRRCARDTVSAARALHSDDSFARALWTSRSGLDARGMHPLVRNKVRRQRS
jgi:glycosyltransferase involved in cell wall biosynthesis